MIESDVIIARPQAEVFAYATDPSRFGEWQSDVVRGHAEGDQPAHVGSRCTMTRRILGSERTYTYEITKLVSPENWAIHGIDGPVRVDVTVTVEPVNDGQDSRVTIQTDYFGHALGRILVPGVVRKARLDAPRNSENLKRQLESNREG